MTNQNEIPKCQVEELEPCPWCNEIPSTGYSTRGMLEQFRISCVNKDCPAPPELKSGGSWPEAIRKWNTRPIENKLTAENVRLQNEVDVIGNLFKLELSRMPRAVLSRAYDMMVAEEKAEAEQGIDPKYSKDEVIEFIQTRCPDFNQEILGDEPLNDVLLFPEDERITYIDATGKSWELKAVFEENERR